MLKELKVKNFRKLRDVTVEFTRGLNVVRGQNEAGKSTMLEAITYALFGVKACREGLSEIVTWGEPEASMKVELTLEVEGITYSITRSKAGAEVNWAGGKATGQTEVANFVGRLFGMSAANINKLVLSGQGNIRGALSEGSTKTSELIEQLSNFSIIDDVLELISERLTTGPTAAYEEAAARAIAELAPLEAALVVPDTAKDEARIADLTQTIAVVTEELEAIQAEIGPVALRRDELIQKEKQLAAIKARLGLLEEQAKAASIEADSVRRQAPPPVDAEELARARTTMQEVEAAGKSLKNKALIEALPYPESFWEGDLASFQAEVAAVNRRASGLQDSIRNWKADLKVQHAARVASATCGFCGQDFSKLPEVAAKNAAIAAEIEAITANLASAEAAVLELDGDIAALADVERQHSQIQVALRHLGSDVAWDTDVVPHRPRWNGNGSCLAITPEAARSLVTTMEAQERAYVQHEAKLAAALARAEAALKARDAAQVEFEKGFPELAELPALTAKAQQLNDNYSALYSTQFDAQRQLGEISARVQLLKQAYEQALAKVDDVRKAKADAEEMIDVVGFNNGLQKRVRAARPIIANKLWSMVLQAVSRYFSEMRGMSSVVTKDNGGFKVDGHAIEGLSGSTLDILGLAIRLALVRTFLPQAPFLILDEPSAACDAERTEATMAFLVTCGFDQMLLVTHEDMSEKVAENLIGI